MWKLVKKEYHANFKFQVLGLVLVAFTSTLFAMLWLNEVASSEPVEMYFDLATGFYAMVVLVSTRINSLMFFMIDEVNDSEAVFASLPVKRGQIVLAKYLSSLGQLVLAISVHLITMLVVTHFMLGLDHPALEFITAPELWIMLVIIIVLLNSFAIPFYLQYGLQNGLFLVLVSQFILIVISFWIYKFFELEDPIQDWLNWVGTNSSVAILGTITLFCFAIISISLKISLKIYNNKEL